MKCEKISITMILTAVLLLSACTAANAPSSNQAAQPVIAAGEPATSKPGLSGQPVSPPPTRQIAVTGNGKVFLVPDIANVSIGVRSQSEKVADALSQNNRQAQAVTSALKELGVEEKDIQTSAFNVFPQPQYDQQGNLKTTDYVVDNTVFVKVKNLSKLGQILDTVVRTGANSINGIQFDVQEKEKAISEARKLAVADARKQAAELTEAAGASLGQVLSINVYTNNIPTPVFDKGGAGLLSAGSQVPVSAGQLILSVDAQLTFELK